MSNVNAINITRLGKILDMTTSSSDNEALVAARKANEIIRGAGHTYGTLLKSVSSSNGGTCAEAALRKQLESERARNRYLDREISKLRAMLAGGKKPASSETNGLKISLLNRAPLLTYERQALTRMETIRPKSKDEYFVLWLAVRYGFRRAPGN